jgi:Xaa-Pro aminopeptidase
MSDASANTPEPLRARGEARELDVKHGRTLAHLRAHGADAAVVRRSDTLTWLLGGADVLVSRQAGPVLEAVVHPGGVDVITNRIEAERLRGEELPDGCTVHAVPWEQPAALAERSLALARELAEGGEVVDDDALDLTDLRWPLLDVELERLRATGRATARTLTDVAGRLTPELSEHAAAGRLLGALRSQGLHVPVVLIAGATRLGTVRHPVPTSAPLGAAALLVVCSEGRGMVCATSRLVRFGHEPGPIDERLVSVLEVEAAMLAATRAGATMDDVLAAARAAYAAVGQPEAWRDHHQGGPIGYRPREWLAVPGDARPVRAGAAYAWNPSLPWAKTEDTFVLTEAGLENVTWDERWPSVTVAGRPRARVLLP